MNKKQITVPVPSLGTRVFANISDRFEKIMDFMTAFLSAIFGESVTRSRALWIMASVLSFSLMIVFASANNLLLTLIALCITGFTAKRGDLFYKEGKGGKSWR